MRLLTCRPERAKTRHLEKQGKTIPAVAVALFFNFHRASIRARAAARQRDRARGSLTKALPLTQRPAICAPVPTIRRATDQAAAGGVPISDGAAGLRFAITRHHQ
jgi:hypothetical protein